MEGKPEEGEEVKVKLIEIDRRTGKSVDFHEKLYYQSLRKKISNEWGKGYFNCHSWSWHILLQYIHVKSWIKNIII